AEDGIRYRNVTGVQTCALPICFQTQTRLYSVLISEVIMEVKVKMNFLRDLNDVAVAIRILNMMYPKAYIHMVGFSRGGLQGLLRSEERRVGKECRSRCSMKC